MKFSTILSTFTALVAAQPVDDKAAIAKRWGDAHGKITWFDDPIGACGRNLDSNSQDFVAISELLWNNLYKGDDPNSAWMCDNHYIVVNYNNKAIRVKLEDMCVGCGYNDLDLSKHAFQKLAPLDVGELHNVWWYWED